MTQSKLTVGLASSPPTVEAFAVRDLRKGFLWAPRELIAKAAPGLGPLPIAVYVALASYANASQVAFPSLSTLSRLLGVSRYAVRRALERLERFNIIRKEQIPGPGRRRVRYVLLDPAVWRLPESADAKPEAQSCTTEEAASETEKVLVASAALAQSGAQPGAIVPEPRGSPPENGQRKGISDLAQLCLADSNGKIADENSNRKRGDSELNGAAQLCQRAKPEGNGNRVPDQAGIAHVTISNELKERTNEREHCADSASLKRRGASASIDLKKAKLLVDLSRELEDIQVRDPQALIEKALSHGWQLEQLLEVASCAGEYSIDASLEDLVNRSAADWLEEIIPRGPKAAWGILKQLIERDLRSRWELPDLRDMIREPLSYRWWNWRLRQWLLRLGDEIQGDPLAEQFLAKPVVPPWDE